MDTTEHTFSALFEQLGLPSDAASIDQFLATHAPLDPSVALSEASFWSAAQAEFLREAIYEDSDWAEVVDQLNTRLRL